MMTQEEKFALVDAVLAARKRGDNAEADRLTKLMPLPAWLAKCALQSVGVRRLDEAKNLGVNFSEVEETYGPEWYNHV